MLRPAFAHPVLCDVALEQQNGECLRIGSAPELFHLEDEIVVRMILIHVHVKV